MKIISIMSDEHSGSAIASSGDKYAVTPALDRLASRGVTFTDAYSTCPVCAPARASYFTGQYVCRLGTWDNSTPYDGTVLGMAEYFGKNGIPFYQIGKTHYHVDGEYHFAGSDELGLLKVPDLGCYYRDQNVARIGAEKRFEEIGISDGSERFDDRVLRSTLKWLDEHGNDESDWILQVGLIEPHFPFSIRQENWDYFEAVFKDVPLDKEMIPPFTSLNSSLNSLRKYFKTELATEDVIKKIRIGYYAAIKEMDEKIGLILDKLEELSLDDEVAVIYTSDHGEQLGYHGLWWKCCMFEQSARIPMIVSVPGGRKGEMDSSKVSLVDVFPTFAEAEGLKAPDDIDGESFFSRINDRDAEYRDYCFSEFNAHGLAGGMYMIRYGSYKYVFYTEDPPQLFDMVNDPKENHNLLEEKGDDPEVAGIAAECRKRLLSICNPYEVTERSLEFQRRMKKALGLPEKYTIGRGGDFVPHPEYKGRIR